MLVYICLNWASVKNADFYSTGEEDATLEEDDGIKITPFNMKEEMEEGHFDTEGYYHWSKEGDDIRLEKDSRLSIYEMFIYKKYSVQKECFTRQPNLLICA